MPKETIYTDQTQKEIIEELLQKWLDGLSDTTKTHLSHWDMTVLGGAILQSMQIEYKAPDSATPKSQNPEEDQEKPNKSKDPREHPTTK